MKHFAVIGNPIAHSRSPDIHRAFAKQTGIALDYQRLEAPVSVDDAGFTETVRAFFAAGGFGLNVTAPFKEPAFRLSGDVGKRALLAAAANTLTGDGQGGWRADNTDGTGLVRDLTGRLGLPLTGRRLLILGAGGATAGVLGPLLEARPARLVLWNRTADKALRLVHRFAAAYPDAALAAVSHFSAVGAEETAFDLVIHATSLREGAGAPEPWPWLRLLCAPDTFFYDLGYADDEATLFLRWAKACGARRCSDGFGMLVEQAAESFRIWHGHLPETAPVFEALRKK